MRVPGLICACLTATMVFFQVIKRSHNRKWWPNVASLLRQNLTEVKFYATSYNIMQHSPTCYLRGGQTDATLTPNNVELCCDRMLRLFDQGSILSWSSQRLSSSPRVVTFEQFIPTFTSTWEWFIHAWLRVVDISRKCKISGKAKQNWCLWMTCSQSFSLL